MTEQERAEQKKQFILLINSLRLSASVYDTKQEQVLLKVCDDLLGLYTQRLDALEQAEQKLDDAVGRYVLSERFRSEDARDQQGDLEMLVKQRDSFKGKLEQAEQREQRVLEALEWLINLGHGLGKAGNKPEIGEFEAAMVAGEKVLTDDTKGEPDG